MSDKLTLPTDIPLQEKPKLLPPDVYLEWVMEAVRHLQEAGRLEAMRHSPSRRPAEVPFRL